MAILCLHAHGALQFKAKIRLCLRSPPEELVMPKSFPRAPAPIVAALVSPLAWLYGRPDLFDTYSCGVLLMQMSGARPLQTLNPKPLKSSPALAVRAARPVRHLQLRRAPHADVGCAPAANPKPFNPRPNPKPCIIEARPCPGCLTALCTAPAVLHILLASGPSLQHGPSQVGALPVLVMNATLQVTIAVQVCGHSG
jgi:hypothetical protein